MSKAGRVYVVTKGLKGVFCGVFSTYEKAMAWIEKQAQPHLYDWDVETVDGGIGVDES